MPYQSYQLRDTARAKTAFEQRAADERLGKLAAAISGPFSQARRKVRAVAVLRSELGRSARLAAADADAAAYLRQQADTYRRPRDRTPAGAPGTALEEPCATC